MISRVKKSYCVQARRPGKTATRPGVQPVASLNSRAKPSVASRASSVSSSAVRQTVKNPLGTAESRSALALAKAVSSFG